MEGTLETNPYLETVWPGATEISKLLLSNKLKVGCFKGPLHTRGKKSIASKVYAERKILPGLTLLDVCFVVRVSGVKSSRSGPKLRYCILYCQLVEQFDETLLKRPKFEIYSEQTRATYHLGISESVR